MTGSMAVASPQIARLEAELETCDLLCEQVRQERDAHRKKTALERRLANQEAYATHLSIRRMTRPRTVQTGSADPPARAPREADPLLAASAGDAGLDLRSALANHLECVRRVREINREAQRLEALEIDLGKKRETLRAQLRAIRAPARRAQSFPAPRRAEKEKRPGGASAPGGTPRPASPREGPE